MSDNTEDKKPPIKLVADNGPVPSKEQRKSEQDIERARWNAKAAWSVAIANVLRAVAGSQECVLDMANLLIKAIEAENALIELTDRPLPVHELREAITPPSVDRKEHYPDTYLDAYGVEQIIQGALRLAAHGVLRERPHFGGKYSTELIKRGGDGIKPDVEVVRVMTRAEEKKYRQERAERDALLKTLRESPPTPGEQQKPWSSRDSISYRDLPKKRP